MRRIVALTLVTTALGAAPAAAHVEILPRTVTQNEFTEFTARVPTERDVPTTAVRIDFPPQVTVSKFAPPPAGWTLREILADDGRTLGVVYKGGTIGLRNYLDFTFLGTGFDTGKAIWKSRQTYADGKVKPWTGPPETPGAASPETGPTEPGEAAAVEVIAAGTSAPATVSAARPSNDGNSGAAIWLGIIAIVAAVGAFLAVAYLWTTRPMTLPEDREPPAS
jgi:uncharacterized protein YcnI